MLCLRIKCIGILCSVICCLHFCSFVEETECGLEMLHPMNFIGQFCTLNLHIITLTHTRGYVKFVVINICVCMVKLLPAQVYRV